MAAQLQAIIPSLLSHDMEATIQFYSDLGFKMTAAAPSPEEPVWCELVRDAIRLHFHNMETDGQPRIPIFSGTLYFRSDDVLSLARDWEHKVTFLWGPDTTPYGWLEFGFTDPNGYVIAVSQDADEASSPGGD